MTASVRAVNLACALAVFVVIIVAYASGQQFGEAKLMYEWKMLEYDWPSEDEKQLAIGNGSYRPERNMLAGIKIYKDSVFLTIPRWLWTSGHPVTLAKVINASGQVKLRPYPTWAAQKQGDCNALQYAQSMEVDSNNGRMYVIDTGRVGSAKNLCPAKIVIYDLNTDEELEKHELPHEVVSRTNNFLNDIVLDYVNGQVRYAYITNTLERRIVIYDFQTRSARYLQHTSMNPEENGATVITINGMSRSFSVPVDGIAMSPDFKYVYYCVLGGYNLYQVPTSYLRTYPATSDSGVRLVGRKVSQTDGLAYGSKHLYYGALGSSAVYYWDSQKDIDVQKVGIDRVVLTTQVKLVGNDSTMQWPDTFGFDERGWIWFISNRLQAFVSSSGIPEGSDAFMRVWKVYINETSYLYQADIRTLTGNSGRAVMPSVTWFRNALRLAMLSSLVSVWIV